MNDPDYDVAENRLLKPYSPTPADIRERLEAHAVLLHLENLEGGGQHSVRTISNALVDICRALAFKV